MNIAVLPTRRDEAWRYADLDALARVWPRLDAPEKIVVAAGEAQTLLIPALEPVDGVAVRAPAGNAPALAQALLPLIESAAIRQDQGARARAYGKDMGSWRDMAARTIGIYEALLAARA